MSFRLIDHYFASAGTHPPPVDEQLLLDYVVGSNGTFARGRRPGLEACVPVARHSVRGLSPVHPYAQWGFPRVPGELLESILQISRNVCRVEPREALFHLPFNPQQHYPDCIDSHAAGSFCGWHLEFPNQRAAGDSVVPVQTGANTSTDRAIIELHSHHYMRAEFSEADDADEAQGFRIYAVIGTIFERPTIRARVGLFGHFLEYPASEFFELPERFTDCNSTTERS